MAYLVQPDYVRYLCSCGQVKTITNLYFCRHCLKIRCGFCICHEVDSHYCANCLENMPSSEARLKKNRCSSCFNCPSCFHSLSTRATQVQPRPDPAGGDAKVENKQPKKMYYLVCFNCRWTSRDVGIPDQPVASGGWAERPEPAAARFTQLLEHYRAAAALAKQERADRERRKFTARGKYITLTDKTGLTGAMARSLGGLEAAAGAAAAGAAGLQPAVASEDVEPLSEDYWTKEPDLKEITSLAQRLAAPSHQPRLASQLRPLPRPLAAKRAQRCRRCDHNLTKPEYSPGSVRFKIELLAVYHVPEVKIVSWCPPELVLRLSNPTGREMTLRLLSAAPAPPDSAGEEESPGPARAAGRAAAAWRAAGEAAPLTLPQRDDAAEYDEDAPPAPPAHPMVVWRKSNKMAIRVLVKRAPSDQSEDSDRTEDSSDPIDPDELYTPEAVEAGRAGAQTALLWLEYSYRNTVPPSAAAPRAPSDHTLTATVLLDLAAAAAQ